MSSTNGTELMEGKPTATDGIPENL